MAELTKTWTFDANADGWSFTPVNATGTYVASGGVTTGYLNVSLTGRNKTDDGSWNITTTFEGLGIPAGSTITGYGLCSFYGRCSFYNVVDYGRHGDLANTEGSLFINDGTLRSLIPSQANYTSTTAWAQFSNNPNITGLNLPSNTSITIHANHDLDLANSAQARFDLDWDNISITVIYTSPAQTDSISLDQSLTHTTASIGILSSLLNLSKSVDNTTFKNIATVVLVDLLNSYSIETIGNTVGIVLAEMQLSNTYTMSPISSAIYSAIASLGIDLSDFITALDSLSAVYINTSASDVGRVEHPVISWTDTSIELAAISKSGLSGSEFYFKVSDRFGAESNWFGPVSILELTINDSITVTYATTTSNISSVLTNTILSLSGIITIDELGTLITSVIVNLANNLDISIVNGILKDVILELQHNFSIDVLISTFISAFLSVNSDYTVESLSAGIYTVLSELTSSYSITEISNLFITTLLEVESNLSINQAAYAILNVVYELHKDVSSFIPAEILGTIILSLQSTYGIDTSLIAILNNIILLDMVLDLEALKILTTAVFATLDIETTDAYIYSAVLNKILDISLNIDIENISVVLSIIFESLDLTSGYTVLNINNIITAAIVFLQNSLDIDTITSIITTSLTTLDIDLDSTTFANIVTTLAIDLTNHYSIDTAISTAITAYLTLVNITSLSVLKEYIGLATVQLSENFDIENIVVGILNSSLTLDQHISLIAQELSGTLANLGLTINYNLVHNVIAEYIISFVIDKALLLDTSRTVEYTGSFDLNTTLDIGDIQRGLNTFSILNTSYNVSNIILSTKSTSALLNVLQQLFVDSNNSNNIFNSAISVGKVLDAETYNRLDTLSLLEIDLNSEMFTSFTTDLNNLISLTQGLSTVNIATLNVTGVLELTNSTVLQLQKFGIINADIDIVNAVSMALVRRLVTEANISIDQVLTIPTGFGFDLLITTPDNRVYIIKFDNRELKVVYEDRTNVILKDNRNKTE